MDAMLGKDTDANIANQLNIASTRVFERRWKIGIPAYVKPSTKIVWDKEKISDLHYLSAQDFANKYNISIYRVQLKRRELLGIRKKIIHKITPELIEEMKQSTQKQLRMKYGFSYLFLNQTRTKYGIVFKTGRCPSPNIGAPIDETEAIKPQACHSVEDVKNLRISELELDYKTINSLMINNIFTIADLLKHDHKSFLLLPNIGRKTLTCVIAALKKHNINY